MEKIALALIIKDDSELELLKRAVNSVRDNVHGVFITATNKPSYKIEKYCKKNGFTYSYFEWVKDFSKARNYNFSQVSKDYGWILWIDTDDVVQGSDTFQQAIQIAESNNVKAIFARYLYQVELDEKGRVKQILIEHLRERLIKNDGTFEWVAPIHETLIEKVPSGKTDFQGFTVVHLVNTDEMLNSMWRNIEILQDEVCRNPQDPRPIYYLAKAYFDTRLPEFLYEPAGEGVESITIELLKDYLAKSGWQEERAQALEYLSMVYREMGNYDKAIGALLKSLAEDPKFISPYIQLALCYVNLGQWEKAMRWLQTAGQIDIPKTTLVVNPRDYKTMMLEALFHVYINTGKLEECEKVAVALDNLLPSDMTKQRVKDIKDLRHRNDMAHWVVKLAYSLRETKQFDKLKELIKAIPSEISEEPVLVSLRNEFSEPKVWDEDSVVIYCGPGFEQWSPKSVARGIGGSEEAVINISRELVKQGWKVTVFADPKEDEGIIDGVEWLPYSKISQKDEFNILIAWRQIGVFDLNLKCKKAYLWNHDIQNSLTYTPERVRKIDKVFFLSKWHRDNVPNLAEDKVMLTANGIDVEQLQNIEYAAK
jgi:tetratricopeptide (TPR) repeat protein